ncbi:MAG: TVP38/TMEM64 family protein [Candidatus Omnitrophica bacterium]|nr:TVP38/TMEM64 family protein [Candidatus Omnitrophota bacterium]
MDKKGIKNIVGILVVIIAFFAVWWIAQCRCVNLKAITPATIRDYIQGFGLWAPVVYCLAYALNTILIVPPIALLSLSAGLVFGKIWGAIFLMMGAVIGTSGTFFLSRLFGRVLVEKIMRGKFKDLDDLLEKRGFTTILFFRVIPLVPYEVLNYASGLSKIKFRDYFFATFVGLIPGVIISAFFGGALGELRSFKDILSFKFIMAFVALLLVIVIPVIYKSLKKKGHYYGRGF